MARTKGKPGPKPKYGEREEIHVLVPVDDLNYIRSVTSNTTEWVIQAIQDKRSRDSAPPPQTPSVDNTIVEVKRIQRGPLTEVITRYADGRVMRSVGDSVDSGKTRTTSLSDALKRKPGHER